MTRTKLTDEEVMAKINALQQSPYVKLAKKIENQAMRQRLYQLRSLDKRGRELAQALGIEVHNG